jgi:radical SAM enzyme (TIGR01210 family)
MNEEKKVSAKKSVVSLMQEIKKLYSGKEINELETIILDSKWNQFDSQTGKTLIMILPSIGCEWALTEKGGCTMCGHLAGTSKGNSLPPDFQFKSFLEKFDKIDFSEFPFLSLYNSGSFLNDREVSPENRKKIYEKIEKEKRIKGLIIESRSNYITQEKIEEIKEFLSEKYVEIGIGLESINLEVNELSVNKNFDLKDFNRASRLIKENKLNLLSYVLVKPPFLTEEEAIEDSIKSAEYALSLGAIVSLEPVSVQKFTLTEYLYLNNFFNPPWVWSAIETIKRLAKKGKVRIGGFEYYPKPSITMHNCEKCNRRVSEAVKEYNKNLDARIFDGLGCECKEEWKKELKKKAETNISERITKTLGKINEKETLKKMKEN